MTTGTVERNTNTDLLCALRITVSILGLVHNFVRNHAILERVDSIHSQILY